MFMDGVVREAYGRLVIKFSELCQHKLLFLGDTAQ